MMREDWVEATITGLVNDKGIFSDGDWVESKDQDQNGDVRLIQLADVGDGVFVNKSNRFLTSQKAKELNCTFLKSGDLLIARLPYPLGRTVIFPFKEDNKYVTVVDVAIVRFGHENIITKLYLYLINSPHIRRKIEELQSGTTRKRISRKNLSIIDFPVLPLPEQRAIVAKIEKLFSELDNAIANLKVAKDKLEIYRQAVLKKAFEGELTKEWRENQENLPTAEELSEQIKKERQKHYENQLKEWEVSVKNWETEGKKGRKPNKPSFKKDKEVFFNIKEADYNIPDAWVKVKLGDICIRASKINRTDIDGDNGFKYFDIGCIDNHANRIVSSKEYKWKDAPSRAQQIVSHKDILFSTVRTYLKNIAMVDNKFFEGEICSTGFTVIRGMENITDAKFIFYLSISDFFIQKLNKLQVGTSYPAVKDDDVFNQLIPLASKQEQALVVQEIETRLSVCDNIQASIDEGLKKAEALRQSILKKAFEGRLLTEKELEACRREPDWEPADKLLKKIKKPKEEGA